MHHPGRLPLALLGIALFAGCSSRVRPTFIHSDTSCLGSDGRTDVEGAMSDEDVSAITALVRARDRDPLMSVRCLQPLSNFDNRAGAEVKATTGVGCHGALTGHGRFFLLNRTGGRWSIIAEGWWAG
jgi:hypothetical protein